MKPEEFINQYEKGLKTQDWNNIESLIHKKACVTFSNGSVHKGKPQVKKAFERNFSLIKDENYSIENVTWVIKNQSMAVYLFDFAWNGIVDNTPTEGSGRGTAVLVNENEKWMLLTEHLGPAQ